MSVWGGGGGQLMLLSHCGHWEAGMNLGAPVCTATHSHGISQVSLKYPPGLVSIFHFGLKKYGGWREAGYNLGLLSLTPGLHVLVLYVTSGSVRYRSGTLKYGHTCRNIQSRMTLLLWVRTRDGPY